MNLYSLSYGREQRIAASGLERIGAMEADVLMFNKGGRGIRLQVIDSVKHRASSFTVTSI